MWCGISFTVLLGPYFFDEVTPTGFITCSVTTSRYTADLQNYVKPELLQCNVLDGMVWMQGGAPPHTAKFVRRALEQHFGDRIISRHFFFSWPLRHPDLTSMDF